MDFRSGDFDEEFEMLETMVGQRITCIWSNRGEREGMKGVLHAVIPYDLIRLDSTLIPFVSPFIAIEAIFDKNGRPIYRNDKAAGYEGCSLRSPLDLVNEQNDMLGYSVAWEEIASHSRSRKAV